MSTKLAMEHDSERAMQKYLMEHPAADPKNHKVKREGGPDGFSTAKSLNDALSNVGKDPKALGQVTKMLKDINHSSLSPQRVEDIVHDLESKIKSLDGTTKTTLEKALKKFKGENESESGNKPSGTADSRETFGIVDDAIDKIDADPKSVDKMVSQITKAIKNVDHKKVSRQHMYDLVKYVKQHVIGHQALSDKHKKSLSTLLSTFEKDHLNVNKNASVLTPTDLFSELSRIQKLASTGVPYRKVIAEEIRGLANKLSGPKTAKEFPTPQALKNYLREHPKADPSSHRVKPQGNGKRHDFKVKPHKDLANEIKSLVGEKSGVIENIAKAWDSNKEVSSAKVTQAISMLKSMAESSDDSGKAKAYKSLAKKLQSHSSQE